MINVKFLCAVQNKRLDIIIEILILNLHYYLLYMRLNAALTFRNTLPTKISYLIIANVLCIYHFYFISCGSVTF